MPNTVNTVSAIAVFALIDEGQRNKDTDNFALVQGLCPVVNPSD
jgi:hypothetical protein